MTFYLKIFCLALPILIALDASWVGVIASGFYKANLGPLLSATPNYGAALLFYIFYTCAIMYFALVPAIREHNFMKSITPALVLGFTTYMAYDLTNLALLANWPLIVTYVDIGWGTLVTVLTSGLTYMVATKVYKV